MRWLTNSPSTKPTNIPALHAHNPWKGWNCKMHPQTYNYNDVFLASGQKVFRPDERDPEWLLRAADHERILRLMKAESRRQNEPKGLVHRLRMVISRA